MKKLLFVLPLTLTLVACSDTEINNKVEISTPKIVEEKSTMSDMPCHQMPDGTWMGKCEETHEHEENVEENHHDTEVEDHDDSDLPPHRH